MSIGARARPRILVVIIAVAALLVALVMPSVTGSSRALAVGASVVVTPTSGPQNSPITVSGDGFPSSTTLQIVFDQTTLGPITTSTTGTFTGPFTVPKDASIGLHPVYALGQPDRASTDFTVTPGDTPTTPGDTPTAPGDTPTTPGDTPTTPGGTPGAPNFYMPVPCNETWRAASYGLSDLGAHPSFYKDPSPDKDSPIDLNNDKLDAWELGRPVLASADGTVYKSESTPYGNLIEINHGSGWLTQYLHLATIEVKYGDSVKSGQRIGTVGDTGAPGAVHLHYAQVHNNELQRVAFDNKPIEYTHHYNGIEYTSGNCHVDRVWTMDDKFNSKSAFCHNDWISFATQVINQSDYASVPLTLTYGVSDNNYTRRFTTTWDHTVAPNLSVNLYTPSKVGADWPPGTYVVTSEVHFHLDKGGESFYGIFGANFTVNDC